MDTQVINITPRSNRERRDHYESNKLVKRLRRQAGQARASEDDIVDVQVKEVHEAPHRLPPRD